MQNISPQRYQTTPRTLIFIFNKNMILLLRNAPSKKLWPNFLNGVGGHVESDETIYASAIREITEETGLHTITSLKLRGIINIEVDQTNRSGVLLFVYIATTNNPNIEPSHEGQPEWFDFKDLPENELVPDLKILLQKLTSLSTDKFLYGRYSYTSDGKLIQDFTIA